jgi:transcription antitermination factor NusG
MPTNRAFEVGDQVEVLNGPFESMTLRVYEITAGHARGLVHIFGRETEVKIAVGSLGAVA